MPQTSTTDKVFTVERIPVGATLAVYTVVDPNGRTIGAHSLRRDAVRARDSLNAEQREIDGQVGR